MTPKITSISERERWQQYFELQKSPRPARPPMTPWDWSAITFDVSCVLMALAGLIWTVGEMSQ